MKFILKAYKKEGRWNNDDPDNGYDEANNELVAGVPEVIETYVGTSDRAEIEVSTEPVEGALKLDLFWNDVGGGVEYTVDFGLGKDNPIIWLCQVFWVYFDDAPKNLYINIRKG